MILFRMLARNDKINHSGYASYILSKLGTGAATYIKYS